MRSAIVSALPTTYGLPSRRLFRTAPNRRKLDSASSTFFESGSPSPIMPLRSFSNAIAARWGEKCDASQNCQRVTSARVASSRGSSPDSGFLDARYCMIARDSVRTKSPSTSVGTAPSG